MHEVEDQFVTGPDDLGEDSGGVDEDFDGFASEMDVDSD